MPRRGKRRRRATPRTADGMQVNIVGHFAVLIVVQVKLHQIALPHANKTAGHVAPKSPERVINPIGQMLGDLLDFEIHYYLRRVGSQDGRRNIGRFG